VEQNGQQGEIEFLRVFDKIVCRKRKLSGVGQQIEKKEQNGQKKSRQYLQNSQ
jgi:hypothetical protein